MDFTTLRVNEHFQNKVVYLFLGVRDKSLYLCIKVAYFKYRSRSLVLIFYISFRKAGKAEVLSHPVPPDIRYFSSLFFGV